MLKEWPLVAFTILGQTAAGMALVLFLPLALSAELFRTPGFRSTAFAVITLVLGLLVAAAALSFFHLSHPLRARRALVNLRTSWLSREILFEIVFIGLVALAWLLTRSGTTAGWLFKATSGAALLAGLLFLACMSRLYTIGSVPAWDAGRTGMSFLLTAATLGALVMARVAGPSPGRPSSPFPLLWIVSAFLVALDAFFAVLLAPEYGFFGQRSKPSLRPPARRLRALFLGRLVLLAGGLLFIVLAMGLSPCGSISIIPPERVDQARMLLTGALALVFGGEIVGRFLFYGLAPRPGD